MRSKFSPRILRVEFLLAGSALLFSHPLYAQSPEAVPEAEIEIEVPAESSATPEPAAPTTTSPTADAPPTVTETKTIPATPAAVSPAPPTPTPTESVVQKIANGIRLSGYLQAQYEHSGLSEDQVQQGGEPLNQDGFSVRRGRFRIFGSWEPVGLELEIDANTSGGPNVSVRRGNVWAMYRLAGNPEAPPLIQLRLGLTEIPFGLEIRQNQEDRMFMERSTGSSALFPGPTDLGARFSGAYGPFRYDIAVMNGSPINDRDGDFSSDPTAAPDVMGRFGAKPTLSDRLEFDGGVSFLYGTGFHPGQDAQKDLVEWRDLNEDGTLNTGELIAVPGRAATPSLTFERWAVGLDAEFGMRTELGWTRLYGELIVGSNLDRGFMVADPVTAGTDLRELSWYIAAVQDLTPWAFVGLRFDAYDPDIDLLDNQRGVRVPVDAGIYTFSPLVGARLPGRARLSFQYDAVFDSLGRDTTGVPADVRNDRWTIRAQVDF